MALRQGFRTVAKAKSGPAPAPPSSWVLSTKGTTTTSHGNIEDADNGHPGDKKTYTLNNGKVYDISNMEPLIESRERFWTNLAKFSSEVFDHNRPGPSVYEVYRSIRSGRPLDKCIGRKPPTASDYCDIPEDSTDEVSTDPHDEDSYSESEDYGVPVPMEKRGNRKFLSFLRLRNRIWQSIRRQREREAREARMSQVNMARTLMLDILVFISKKSNIKMASGLEESLFLCAYMDIRT